MGGDNTNLILTGRSVQESYPLTDCLTATTSPHTGRSGKRAPAFFGMRRARSDTDAREYVKVNTIGASISYAA